MGTILLIMLGVLAIYVASGTDLVDAILGRIGGDVPSGPAAPGSGGGGGSW